MTSTEYIVAGHSHMIPMGEFVNYQGPLELVKSSEGQGYFLIEAWRLGRGAGYWQALIEASSGRDVLIVFQGNQHHSSFLFAPHPLFDFFDPQTTEILSEATLVPRRLVEAFFDPSFDQLRELLPNLLKAGCRAIRIVGTPPPKSDLNAFSGVIRELTIAQRYAQETGMDLDQLEITPAPLLLKLWRVIQELMARVAASSPRTSFVPVPTEAIDEKGFLRKCFYDYVKHGITHGNRDFGRLMLRHALATLPS